MILKNLANQEAQRAQRLDNYCAQGVNEVDGWLLEPSVTITRHLGRMQQEQGIQGSLAEIGVWRGKYLILLYLLARPNEAVVAVDSWIHIPPTPDPAQTFVHNVIRHAGDVQQLTLLPVDSMTLSPAELVKHGRGKFRLFSVDGGHGLAPVRSDLCLMADVLADGGVACIDDIFNTMVPGVAEGACRFFFEDNRDRLAPFAYAANKLYVTTTSHYELYFHGLREFLRQNNHRSDFQRTLEYHANLAAGGFKVELFGREILTLLV